MRQVKGKQLALKLGFNTYPRSLDRDFGLLFGISNWQRVEKSLRRNAVSSGFQPNLENVIELPCEFGLFLKKFGC